MTQELKWRDKDKTGLLVYQTCYSIPYPLKLVQTKNSKNDNELSLLFKYYLL